MAGSSIPDKKNGVGSRGPRSRAPQGDAGLTPESPDEQRHSFRHEPWHHFSLRFVGERGRDGLVLERSDGLELRYRSMNGMRWWSNGLIRHEDVDEAIGNGSGYSRMLEWLWRQVTRALSDQWVALREAEERVHEYARREVRIARREHIQARTIGRHIALREWRSPSPLSELPKPLRGIRGLQRLHPDQPCYVYFLVHKGEVVYVGQTTRPVAVRIEAHTSDPTKVFDEAWYVPVDRESLDRVELKYIREFCPCYNVKHNTEIDAA